MKIGARCLPDDRCEFVVWAPHRRQVAVSITEPEPRLIPLARDQHGYWRGTVDHAGPGTRYVYRLNNLIDRPDPASRYQPDGVHGDSAILGHEAFIWRDDSWECPSHAEFILYELHVGTFTPDGTFDAIIPRLPDLHDLGINALSIMPVAEFPGGRNWGYDGVFPFAVQSTYGGPNGLKKLVDAAHRQGIAVVLDVVYNHVGPEGNYLYEFGPYFTETYKTPWGEAINYDGPYSDDVRNYFIENALAWFRDFHIDGLRLDAIHGIFDSSARPFLQELAETVAAYADEAGRRCILIAESDLNDPRVIHAPERGGHGIPAQWSDDFHHALHTLLTGEHNGYYQDFGRVEDLVTAIREGFVYAGRYSNYRRRAHGSPTTFCTADQFVVYSQTHDQVGNRMKSERLSCIVSFEALKLAAGAVLLGPNVPMIFMGEEYGEIAPFHYFISHSDQALADAVRAGRKEEFKSFGWDEEPADPQSEDAFKLSMLHWDTRTDDRRRDLLRYYRRLIALRKSVPALSVPDWNGLHAVGIDSKRVIIVRRKQEQTEAMYLMNFNSEKVSLTLESIEGSWHKALDSAEHEWSGPGPLMPDDVASGQHITMAPWSLTLYLKEDK